VAKKAPDPGSGSATLDDVGDAGDVTEMKRSSLFMSVMWEVAIKRLKSSTGIDHFPLRLEPMPNTSVALMAQYLNVKTAIKGIVQKKKRGGRE
jgi:hypothetical protein